MARGLIVFGPDGQKHRASPVEQAAFDAEQAARQKHDLAEMLKALDDHKRDKVMYKELRAKGLQQPKTRGSFAYRMRHRSHSAVKFESYSERVDKYGTKIPPQADIKDWDYCPPGEGTLWRLKPVTRVKDFDVFDVGVVWFDGKRKRKRWICANFKRNCAEGTCGKDSCAMCWAIEHMPVKENETIITRRRDGPNPRVVDSSGVHPKGARSAKAKDMGLDQRSIFHLTSSQLSHKEGASQHGRNEVMVPDAVVSQRMARARRGQS